MELTLILCSVIILSAIVRNKWDYKYELLCEISVLICSIALLIHIIFVGVSSYEYGRFKVEGKSLENTLKFSRENNQEIERAAIISKISDWNQCLDGYKYDNKTFILDPYIDDRIEKLKPIQ